MLTSWWAGLIAGVLLVYLLLRFNSLWIYRFDQALRNKRNALDPLYEWPHYYRLNNSGSLDTEVDWPGWDGWYFFLIPRGSAAKAQMIRASVMTGLYGLEGVDSYALLPTGVSSRNAIEYLMLISADEAIAHNSRDLSGCEIKKTSTLVHFYVPKSDLRMKICDLEVAIQVEGLQRPSGQHFSGRVRGKWPEYSFHFTSMQSCVDVDVRFQASDLVWWADLPGIFTYFSAFGEFSGTISRVHPDEKTGQSMPFRGRGAFEHGFARKPWNFDLMYKPVRAVQKIFRAYRPIRYHYESFVSDGLHGGWMHGRAFGIDFRNRGGFYWDEQYVPIQSVDVEYAEPEQAKFSPAPTRRTAVSFYRRWKVRAKTEYGVLEYVARRESPPPPVAPNMTYYHLTLDGFYRGREIQGSGYGEYLNI